MSCLAVGACLVAGSAAIHLHLWAAGYRTVPTIGPLFLVQGASGIVLGVLMVVFRRAIAALAGAGFLAATAGGFLISVSRGLFGFHDTFAAPLATLSLAIESGGVVVLVVAAALLRSSRRAPVPRGSAR
ncbi:MAG: hypothetical protein M0Z69_09100 [Actinomycetota bacterium]|nr:hypothetical protein [Actinomycetota bacterium]